MPNELESFDAVVVGGGTAGLSAALALGRATRRVLLASCGAPRNAPAHAAHNTFTRDGTPPAELVRIGRAQLAPYDVAIRDECVIDAHPADNGYVITLPSGQLHTRGIILASGVRDVLPDIPGFQELWGSGVFHCPYCHGWEVAKRPLGIYGKGDDALHFVTLIRGWTNDLMLFTDGPSELAPDVTRKIRSHGITIREEKVQRLVGTHELEAIVLDNGETIARAGLFIRPKQELRSDLAHKLGCEITAQGRVHGDAVGRTSVARVYVAGDMGPGHQSVPSAAATGAVAGAGLNLELLAEDF
jgi:thioredoxin reductase